MPEPIREIGQNEAKKQSSPLPKIALTAKVVPLFTFLLVVV